MINGRAQADKPQRQEASKMSVQSSLYHGLSSPVVVVVVVDSIQVGLTWSERSQLAANIRGEPTLPFQMIGHRLS